jgi:RNA polymerase sigma factor (sigma-70 family)
MIAKPEARPILQFIRRVVEDPQVRELSDRDLLQRFHSQHDEAAFHTLLRRHGPMVLNVCGAVLGDGPDAEDAFQATFLVLAHKARSICKGASLGSWLHGVARRTALKARARSAARQKHEARAPARQASEADDLSWREVRQVLHEELDGMPERYREALLLCYLEGATQPRAAARLGLAERTVRERLERGRELLRARLVRRGLGTAALLLSAAWPAALASAQPPLGLVSGTVQAATLVAAGQGMAGAAISSNVTALSKEVLKTMVVTKLKHIAVVLVCGAAFIGAVALNVGSTAADQGPAPAANYVAAADGEPAAGGPVKTKTGAGPGSGFGTEEPVQAPREQDDDPVRTMLRLLGAQGLDVAVHHVHLSRSPELRPGSVAFTLRIEMTRDPDFEVLRRFLDRWSRAVNATGVRMEVASIHTEHARDAKGVRGVRISGVLAMGHHRGKPFSPPPGGPPSHGDSACCDTCLGG